MRHERREGRHRSAEAAGLWRPEEMVHPEKEAEQKGPTHLV